MKNLPIEPDTEAEERAHLGAEVGEGGVVRPPIDPDEEPGDWIAIP
ncbi:hypothetical protein [Nonomuraea sp. NPDC049158]|jgi:hypothetical protein